jgi:hypothetical protein
MTDRGMIVVAYIVIGVVGFTVGLAVGLVAGAWIY